MSRASISSWAEGLSRSKATLSAHAGVGGLSARCDEGQGNIKTFYFAWPSSGPTADFLKGLWQAQGWPRKGWTLSVSVKHGVFRPQRVPAVSTAEIRAILSLQALRQMPLSPEEIATDFVPIRSAEKGLSDVLMVILLKKELDSALRPFHEAGLVPGRVLPSALSMAGLELGKPGWEDLFGGEDASFFRKVLDGATSEAHLAEGAARWKHAAPDFLPADVRERQLRSTRARRLVTTGFLCAGILLVLGGLHAHRASTQRTRLAALQAARSAHALQVRRLADMVWQIDLLKGGAESSRTLSRLLSTLAQSLPSDVAVESVAFDRGKGVLIQGSAFTFARVVEAVNALEATKRFSRVEMKSSSASRLHDRDLVSFQIECLWPEEGGKPS